MRCRSRIAAPRYCPPERCRKKRTPLSCEETRPTVPPYCSPLTFRRRRRRCRVGRFLRLGLRERRRGFGQRRQRANLATHPDLAEFIERAAWIRYKRERVLEHQIDAIAHQRGFVPLAAS